MIKEEEEPTTGVWGITPLIGEADDDDDEFICLSEVREGSFFGGDGGWNRLMSCCRSLSFVLG